MSGQRLRKENSVFEATFHGGVGQFQKECSKPALGWGVKVLVKS